MVSIYLYQQGKIGAQWFNECFGPFASTVGAQKAKEIVDAFNKSMQYRHTVSVRQQDGTPKVKTMPWRSWVRHSNMSNRERTEAYRYAKLKTF